MQQENKFFYPLTNIFNKTDPNKTDPNKVPVNLFDKKRNYKIAIYGEPPYLIPHKDDTGVITYSGFLYDIWKYIYLDLKKYPDIGNIKQEFIIPSDTGITYDTMFDLVTQGKYDMAVGNFSVLSKDDGRGDNLYTRPIYLDKLAIGYIGNDYKLEWFFKVFYSDFLSPLFFLMLLCIIFGLLLFRYNPRGSFVTGLWQSIAALLGEAGYMAESLSDNPNKQNWKSYFIVFIILLFSFYFGMYLQARVTTGLSELYQSNKLLDTLDGRKILKQRGTEGYNFVHNKLGGTLLDIPLDKDLFEYYVLNHSKYNGVVESYPALVQAQKKFPNLKITTNDWGYNEIAFIIHNNIQNYNLQTDINKIIVSLQERGIIINKCRLYLGQDNSYLCQL
jgi:ABC-type amino acid transport substrate-binding protein